MHHVAENSSLSESSLPPCILLKLQSRGIVLEAKALATLIFALIRRSACGILGECDLFYSDNKNELLILVQLPDGISLLFYHTPVLPTNGHTNALNA